MSIDACSLTFILGPDMRDRDVTFPSFSGGVDDLVAKALCTSVPAPSRHLIYSRPNWMSNTSCSNFLAFPVRPISRLGSMALERISALRLIVREANEAKNS
jgi:hypothetical protein